MDFIQGLLGDEFLSKAFILSMITGLLIYLKGIPNIIWNRIRRLIFFSVTIEQTDELYEYIEKWLFDNYPDKYRNVIANINYRNFALNEGYRNEVTESQSDSLEDECIVNETISYRNNNDIVFIKMKGVYVRVDKNREKLDHAVSLTNLFFDHYTFSVFFFKKRLQDLLDEIVEYNQQFKPSVDNVVNIYSFNGYREFYRVKAISPKSVDNVILDHDLKDSILFDIDNFIKSKKWYLSRSIPYKRGYLFHGEPGNGKTSMALALANYLKKDIFVVNLNEVSSDSDLKSMFTNIGANSILLIEDIDAIFNGRKSKGKISFSALLNCLDGVFYENGMITIITTNHIEKLDPALIRDGRVDLKVEFTNPKSIQIKEYIELFFEKKLNGDIFREGYSMSKIQNMCLNSSIDKVTEELIELDKVLN